MANDVFTSFYNPDVLSCLANLSSDEVFTLPDAANRMLDLLPPELFHDPATTFLDPGCKSGVFLREIAKRLIKGLEEAIPDLQERIDHILHHQLYGIAITELTSLLSRRSLYCSKYPNCRYSVTRFDDEQGNIHFRRTPHRWKDERCIFCGASQSQYDRGDAMETHAYEWIHTGKPEEILGMKFDVIVGNPPYQLETDGAGRQARPIYHRFVMQSKTMNPSYLVMITPSRWLAGGMGLDDFRNSMLNDSHLREIVDYSLSTECFPGVDIAGGVSYFLWDREYSGQCRYTYVDGDNRTTQARTLNEYDVFVRNNRAVDIIKKVVQFQEPSMSELMSPLGPFGLGTAERGSKTDSGNSYVLLSSAGRSYVDRSAVAVGNPYVSKWKVIIGKATSAGAATAGRDGRRKVIATLDVLEPDAVCTFSYFVGAAFDDEARARNCRAYLATKFARFLLLQRLSAINISRDRFRFVPQQDFTVRWSDSPLYVKYGLTNEEIALIEATISPMDSNGDNDGS